MNNIPLISVVMPVYNVEKYLQRAVSSVLEQTYRNFELFLIDDCSTDESGCISDKCAETDERISVVHLEKNGGLSNARNIGLGLSNGDYIFFIDSDDYIDNDLFLQVYDSLKINKADVIVFGLEEDYFDKNNKLSKKYVLKYGESLYLNNVDEVRRKVIFLEQKTFYGYAWNKFYNLAKLKELKLKFEHIELIEDVVFNIKCFNNIISLNVLNIAPYHYMKRIDGSLTNKFIKDYFNLNKQRIKLIYDQYTKWNLCTDEVKTILANIFARYIFSALQRNNDVKSGLNKKEKRLWIDKLYKDNLFNQLLPYMNSSGLIGFLEYFLKKKDITCCLLISRFIYFTKNKTPILFAAVKRQ